MKRKSKTQLFSVNKKTETDKIVHKVTNQENATIDPLLESGRAIYYRLPVEILLKIALWALCTDATSLTNLRKTCRAMNMIFHDNNFCQDAIKLVLGMEISKSPYFYFSEYKLETHSFTTDWEYKEHLQRKRYTHDPKGQIVTNGKCDYILSGKKHPPPLIDHRFRVTKVASFIKARSSSLFLRQHDIYSFQCQYRYLPILIPIRINDSFQWSENSNDITKDVVVLPYKSIAFTSAYLSHDLFKGNTTMLKEDVIALILCSMGFTLALQETRPLIDKPSVDVFLKRFINDMKDAYHYDSFAFFSQFYNVREHSLVIRQDTWNNNMNIEWLGDKYSLHDIFQNCYIFCYVRLKNPELQIYDTFMVSYLSQIFNKQHVSKKWFWKRIFYLLYYSGAQNIATALPFQDNVDDVDMFFRHFVCYNQFMYDRVGKEWLVHFRPFVTEKKKILSFISKHASDIWKNNDWEFIINTIMPFLIDDRKRSSFKKMLLCIETPEQLDMMMGCFPKQTNLLSIVISKPSIALYNLKAILSTFVNYSYKNTPNPVIDPIYIMSNAREYTRIVSSYDKFIHQVLFLHPLNIIDTLNSIVSNIDWNSMVHHSPKMCVIELINSGFVQVTPVAMKDMFQPRLADVYKWVFFHATFLSSEIYTRIKSILDWRRFIGYSSIVLLIAAVNDDESVFQDPEYRDKKMQYHWCRIVYKMYTRNFQDVDASKSIRWWYNHDMDLCYLHKVMNNIMPFSFMTLKQLWKKYIKDVIPNPIENRCNTERLNRDENSIEVIGDSE